MRAVENTISTATSRRRLPSPGCLLMATLIATLTLMGAWVGWRLFRPPPPLRYFEQLGARVDTEPLSPVWIHDLVQETLGPESALHFQDITAISLYQVAANDRELEPLRDLRQLKQLVLTSTHITDEAAATLGTLPRLKWLWLDQTAITDRGVEELCRSADLEVLSLDNTAVTDASVRHVARLTGLRQLSLDGVPITDGALPWLTSLTNLEVLTLDDTEVTDAGLQDLARLGNLREVWLVHTAVSPEGAARLHARLPACEVHVSPRAVD